MLSRTSTTRVLAPEHSSSRNIISVTVDKRPFFFCLRMYMEKLTTKYNALVKKNHRLTWNTFVGRAIDMTTSYKHKYLQSSTSIFSPTLLKICHFTTRQAMGH